MKELDVLTSALRDASTFVTDPKDIHSKDTAIGTYDIVTDVDSAVESFVIGRIRSEFPKDSIIAEESSPDAESRSRTWILDPIDGTVNMSRGIPLFGMQGAFQIHDKPIASAIYLPIHGEMFTATEEGAYMNSTKIETSEPRPLKNCILTTGDFSRRSEDYRRMQALLLFDCRDCVARFKMFGAACIDFAYLACGRSDIHLRFVNKVWDFFPGMYLAEKAGAVYDEELLQEHNILMMCSCKEVLDEALAEIPRRIMR